ncbi:MAG: hypothetical protein FWC89_04715 [Defluviitaleaceae bacterium]|nr:hypothetical protein [Defluviitaleaceae bacterium]
MASVYGITDSQFNKHLADTLHLLELARKEITCPAPILDDIIKRLEGQVAKP